MKNKTILALGLAHHRSKATFGFIHGLDIKMRRYHRQMREAPFAAFDIVAFRRLYFQQMPHGAGDDIALVFKIVVEFVEFAHFRRERTHDVLSN